jgi:hypothetical protein
MNVHVHEWLWLQFDKAAIGRRAADYRLNRATTSHEQSERLCISPKRYRVHQKPQMIHGTDGGGMDAYLMKTRTPRPRPRIKNSQLKHVVKGENQTANLKLRTNKKRYGASGKHVFELDLS